MMDELTIKEKYDWIIDQREQLIRTADLLGVSNTLFQFPGELHGIVNVSYGDTLELLADRFGIDTINCEERVSGISDTIKYKKISFIYRNTEFFYYEMGV